MALFIAAGTLNLNRFQMPEELYAAFLTGLAGEAWRTPLGYVPEAFRGTVAITVLALVPLFAAAWLAAVRIRGGVVPAAAVYLLLMSGFLFWCGLHPRYDAIARSFVDRHERGELTSAGARDTIGLLRDEAYYMERVGRTGEAESALREAAAIRP
jgi:hypothetical protein